MPFNSYSSAAEVAQAHRVHIRREKFIEPVAASLSDYFRGEMAFTLKEVVFGNSESAAYETLVYPLLREVWKPHRQLLSLWSHQPLEYDDDLCGVPDYMISRRSPLGFAVPDQPFFFVVEAKEDDFERGWGQCLAAMLAAQKLSEDPSLTFYGTSTNGRSWEFGRLEGNEFTQDLGPNTIADLDVLAASLHFVLLRCLEQATRLPVGV